MVRMSQKRYLKKIGEHRHTKSELKKPATVRLKTHFHSMLSFWSFKIMTIHSYAHSSNFMFQIQISRFPNEIFSIAQ